MSEARKYPLRQQIAAVELELRDRQQSRGKMSRSEAEYQVARLEAALSTLRWVEANEAKIRGALTS